MKEKELKNKPEEKKRAKLSDEAVKRLTELSMRISDLMQGGDADDVQ